MIYSIKIKEKFAPDANPCVLERFIDVESGEKLERIVADTVFLKSRLDELYDDALVTLNDLVEEGYAEEFEYLLSRRPYLKSFKIEDWDSLDWYTKLYDILRFIMKNENVKYTNVSIPTIEVECS